MVTVRKFLLYLLRWQLSTPILWLVVRHLGVGIASTVIANLIGGAIFFWVDRFIFTSKAVEMWHFKEKGICDNCGAETALWRLVLAPNYDKRNAEAKFFCMKCSKQRTDELRRRGIKIRGRSN
ncbi:MAG: hypothetical protein PHR44_07545 [Candidatus Omnitrophica bacterium]|nr:hypothetical protein [Candidatus Omnitrophota bacterium]